MTELYQSNSTRGAHRFAVHASRLFTAWLAQQRASIALTTYQAGKIFLIGLKPDGQLSIVERSFNRPMGLGQGKDRFWMSSLYQLWRFEGFLNEGEVHNDYDQVFVPVTGHTTGDIDIHDIHENASGQPVFVATRFNCLATLGIRGSFRELWRPPFIDRIAAEDRCHLNGLAMSGGQPAYVTTLSRTNVADGWREHRRDGGLIIDVKTGEFVAQGLSMPHSPRIHGNDLWALQAGTGEFGRIDLARGSFEPVCFMPGFTRGVSMTDSHAVIGISRPRENRTFEGLVLNERLEREGISAQCGICVVNLRTGDVEHHLMFEGVMEEIYDVALLPGVLRPMVLGFRTDEISFTVRPELASAVPTLKES